MGTCVEAAVRAVIVWPHTVPANGAVAKAVKPQFKYQHLQAVHPVSSRGRHRVAYTIFCRDQVKILTEG